MRKVREWIVRFGGLFDTRRKDRELDDEIESHLRMHIEDNRRLGMTPNEARRQAMIKLGGVESTKEAYRDQRGLPVLETGWQDIRFSIRMMRKNPGFTTVAVLTLALGIGANTALFSVVNGVLLNPLPYPQPEELVTLHQSKPNFANGAIPYPNFLDWQKENTTFSAMAISRPDSFSLLEMGGAERVRGQWVSAEFFTVLGLEPALGRNFARNEDVPGSAPVVLISAQLWQRKFGAAQDVSGKSLTLDNRSCTVIGVLPSSFKMFRGTDVYLLIGQSNHPGLRSRSAGLYLHGIGRLKPGITLVQAQADLEVVMRRLAELYPAANRANGATVVALKESLVGDVEAILWILSGAVGFVFAVACVNVSNLLLARSSARTIEFAIRSAVGAGRWRLLRQLLTESLLLGLAGGAWGCAIGAWGTKLALAALPGKLPRAEEIGLDGRVLFFTMAISLLAGVLAGLAPVLKGNQGHLAETLKEGGRAASDGRHRPQRFLVAVEMALALVLLIGAGLMIRSLNALWRVDPGFRADNVLTFNLSFPPSLETSDPAAVRAFVRDVSDRLNSVPGIKAASFSSGAAPLLDEDDLYFWIDGQPRPASSSDMHAALVYRVEPGYLTAMGIPLKQGRFFSNQDDERAQAVAVIDDVFARQYFPNSNPIGRRINIGSERDPLQIIGVVGHVNQWSLHANDAETLQAQFYEPFRQLSDSPTVVSVFVRFERVPDAARIALFDSIRRVVQSQNSQNVVFGGQTINKVIADSLARHRFSTVVLNAFALIALLLAAIGLYGVISYLVNQRTREIGIRVALGAQRSEVLFLILRQGLGWVASGVLLGLLGALALSRVLITFLYAVKPYDLLTLVVVSALLLLVGLFASLLPAQRAARMHPVAALK